MDKFIFIGDDLNKVFQNKEESESLIRVDKDGVVDSPDALKPRKIKSLILRDPEGEY